VLRRAIPAWLHQPTILCLDKSIIIPTILARFPARQLIACIRQHTSSFKFASSPLLIRYPLRNTTSKPSRRLPSSTTALLTAASSLSFPLLSTQSTKTLHPSPIAHMSSQKQISAFPLHRLDYIKGEPLDLAAVKGKNIVVVEMWSVISLSSCSGRLTACFFCITGPLGVDHAVSPFHISPNCRKSTVPVA
jgi:hypothetical protein